MSSWRQLKWIFSSLCCDDHETSDVFSDARSLTTTNSNSFIMTERHIVTIVYSKILQNLNEKSLTLSPSVVGHWVLALKTSLSFGDGNSSKIRKNRSFLVNKMRFDIIVYMCQTKQLVGFFLILFNIPRAPKVIFIV